MNVFDIWTDGASEGRTGCRGGWAALLVSQDGTKLAISGYEESTTNNRMELMGVIQGLQAIGTERAIVTIFTDSAYVKNPQVRGWTTKWQREGWVTYEGKPVANRDLWEQLINLCSKHLVKWQKVRGHSTSVLNNLVDKMAVEAKKSGMGTVEIL